jgi:hypothetical protein
MDYNLLYIYIMKSQVKQEQFIIDNQTDLNLVYGQINQQTMQIKGQHQEEFGWDEPMKSKVVVVIFNLLNTEHRIEVNMDKMNSFYQVDDTNIVIETQISGVTRKILV